MPLSERRPRAPRWTAPAWSGFLAALVGGCSGSDAVAAAPEHEAEAPDGGGGEAGGASDSAPAPTATDGSAACGERWPNVTDGCWSCLCDTCPTETENCTRACWEVVQCGAASSCFTGDFASETVCLVEHCGDSLGAAMPEVATWDRCLIEAGAGGTRRACDVECGIH